MATIGGYNVVTDGLVLSYDASNKKSYVSGSIMWNDLSGNRNTGSLVNGPTFDTNNLGSILFDGVDDRINLPYLNYPTSSDITIEIFTKINETLRTPTQTQINFITASSAGRYDAYYYRILSVGNSIPEIAYFTAAYGSTGKYDFYLRILDNNLNNYPVIFSDTYNTSGILTSSDTKISELLPGNIFHYVWSISNVSGSRFCRHYLNSKNLVSSQFIGSPPSDDISFFQRNNLRLAGKNNIYLFKIYNRVLSDVEITQNYNATKGRFGL